jgi:hypothetical protein
MKNSPLDCLGQTSKASLGFQGQLPDIEIVGAARQGLLGPSGLNALHFDVRSARGLPVDGSMADEAFHVP